MEKYLLENEHVLQDYYYVKKRVVLTNLRVIKFWSHGNERDFIDMHYRFIETIRHCQKLSWSLIGVGLAMIGVGFLPLLLFDQLIISAFLWTLGVIFITQAYFFSTSYVEIKTANSRMILPNNPEIARHVRKYQEKYFRGSKG